MQVTLNHRADIHFGGKLKDSRIYDSISDIIIVLIKMYENIGQMGNVLDTILANFGNNVDDADSEMKADFIYRFIWGIWVNKDFTKGAFSVRINNRNFDHNISLIDPIAKAILVKMNFNNARITINTDDDYQYRCELKPEN